MIGTRIADCTTHLLLYIHDPTLRLPACLPRQKPVRSACIPKAEIASEAAHIEEEIETKDLNASWAPLFLYAGDSANLMPLMSKPPASIANARGFGITKIKMG